MTHGYWGRFADATRDLSNAQAKSPEGTALAHKIADLIQRSQRFYFPDHGYVLDGRELDAGVKQLLRLPFPLISILYDGNLLSEDRADVTAAQM